jgi:hypothetical protein
MEARFNDQSLRMVGDDSQGFDQRQKQNHQTPSPMKAQLSADQIARLLGTPKAVEIKPVKRERGGVLLHPRMPDDTVRDIRRRWAAGEPLRSIADRHKVTRAAVSLIGSGQRRREVL